MVVGVQKLQETENIVSSLQADLTKLEPILVKKTKDAEELLEKVANEKEDADVVITSPGRRTSAGIATTRGTSVRETCVPREAADPPTGA